MAAYLLENRELCDECFFEIAEKRKRQSTIDFINDRDHLISQEDFAKRHSIDSTVCDECGRMIDYHVH
jgi:hypothetical protein